MHISNAFYVQISFYGWRPKRFKFFSQKALNAIKKNERTFRGDPIASYHWNGTNWATQTLWRRDVVEANQPWASYCLSCAWGVGRSPYPFSIWPLRMTLEPSVDERACFVHKIHLPPLGHWSENEATGFVQNEPHYARERRPRFGQQGLSALLCSRQITKESIY